MQEAGYAGLGAIFGVPPELSLGVSIIRRARDLAVGVPILLLWVYMVWLIVLLGAVIAAYLPSLLSGISRRADHPGWRFQLALELLRELQAHRGGQHLAELAQTLRLDPLQLEGPLEAVESLGWIGSLQDGRYVLLVDTDSTTVAPLAERLLLERNANTRKTWEKSLLSSDALTLKELL